jgi:hypothetical protein
MDYWVQVSQVPRTPQVKWVMGNDEKLVCSRRHIAMRGSVVCNAWGCTMISVLKKLMDGNSERTLLQLTRVKSFWDEFLPAHQTDNVPDLAKALSEAQTNFEIKCFDWDRSTAKELMAVTCLTALYDEQSGFQDKAYAKRLVSAFRESMVSIEVKGTRLNVAEAMFHLDGG